MGVDHSPSLDPASGRVVIGRRFVDEDGYYCSVTVDELMMWNRALSDAEVMSLYNLAQ